ncbi:hypothetical protein [uncultured Duncaniella sp.]|jgi:hypothetical protein|uniref:hypothetical protein n=1 Tax=uncultured Duncaniella sp. TaxID=2768039 RepID=UPI0025B0441D|nr:hypothetical protein [uncultured Duncaniella sp.]
MSKLSVKDLVINPINPRKISTPNKRRLQQSIMLFPKMLYYRDIIVNKENVILAGNQRVATLLEILNSPSIDWMLVLQENEKWMSYTEAVKDQIIEYWKKWVENPLVEVTVAEDLTEEEEKELIIKDNNEFGEFDYNKLPLLFDEIGLINFGFDEGLFYDPTEDDTLVTKYVNGMGQGRKVNTLKFGRSTIAVTREEYDRLVERYEEYVQETGVDFGFIRSIFQKQ